MARHGWLGVLPRHPHNSTCVRPPVMGIHVVSTIEWLQGHRFQKQKAKSKKQKAKQRLQVVFDLFLICF
ncbi:hypothetical protein HKD51_28130 [Pseudomonas fragi]|nr:hypothetical protein [Pseudomonas sp. GC01]